MSSVLLGNFCTVQYRDETRFGGPPEDTRPPGVEQNKDRESKSRSVFSGVEKIILKTGNDREEGEDLGT